MAEHDVHEDHGHSVAAWTGVAIILVGTAVMSLAIIFPSVLWFVVGAVVCLVGAVAWKLLNMAGYGAVTHDGPDAPESARPEVGVK